MIEDIGGAKKVGRTGEGLRKQKGAQIVATKQAKRASTDDCTSRLTVCAIQITPAMPSSRCSSRPILFQRRWCTKRNRTAALIDAAPESPHMPLKIATPSAA